MASEWTLQVSSSRIQLDSDLVFIFERGSVSAWEFLPLLLISSNLDHSLRAKIPSHRMRITSFFFFFLFSRLQYAPLHVGWNTCLSQLHAHLCDEAFFFSFLFCVIPLLQKKELIHFFFLVRLWEGSLFLNKPPTLEKVCQMLCRRWSASQSRPVNPPLWQREG